MARARILKPGFFSNPELCALPIATRMLFAGLWTLADREGRLLDRPAKIHGELFPYDHALDVDVDAALTQLHDAGFVVRYAVDDQRLIAIVKWAGHQHPHHREPKSTLPPPKAPPKAGPKAATKARPKSAPKATPKATPEAEPRAQPGGIRNTEYGIQNTHRRAEPRAQPEAPPKARALSEPLNPEQPRGPQTLAGVVCIALKGAGVSNVNPSHPTLIALLEAGVPVAEFVDAARNANDKRDPFAYLLGVVKGRRIDAVQVANGVHLPPPNPDAWRDSHDGVITRANHLGINGWDQGITEDWHAFRRRVIEADERRKAH